MKKIIAILAIVVAGTTMSFAQKIVFVDTEAVLNAMPEYQDAQKQIDRKTQQWQKDVQQKYQEIENLYKAFRAEEVLLTEDLRQRREQEIIDKEKSLKDFQKEKFGFEGGLFKLRQDLVKPIQDSIYEAIAKMANQRAYDFVLDKSSGISVLYANDKYDKTEEIMKDLNLID